MIEVRDLTFGYKKGEKVLKDVSFSLREGVTLLIGENASGKSTLMKILTGSLPDSKSVYIDGKLLNDKIRKRTFSYLPQEFIIYPSLRVKDVIEFVCKAKGIANSKIKDVIEDVSLRTNIKKFLNHKFKNTSVGTQRRIGVATALIGDPDVIILDEPTAGVDPKERARFYEVISDLFYGKTVLISSHILDDMDILADNVIMLSDGRINFDGGFSLFRHSLDDRVYEINRENMSIEDEEILRLGVIIKERRTEEGRVARVVLPANYNPSVSFRNVNASLEDIWEYYLRVNHG